MRGEAALKSRLQKETRKNASISPYEAPFSAALHSEMEEQDPPCTGELQQHTQKGNYFTQSSTSVSLNHPHRISFDYLI